MNSIFSDYFLNSSVIDVVQLYWNAINVYIFDTITLLRENLKSKTIASVFESLPSTPLQFDDFKWNLLKIFTALLFVNLILIAITWRIYGKRICDRFMNLSES